MHHSMTRLLLLGALFAASASFAAAPAIGSKGDSYPQHEVTFANGTRGIAGVVYSRQVGYRPLTLDLYLPPTSVQRPAGGFPMVVYIHGGAWLGGDPRNDGPFADFPGVLASLAQRGYVVASVQYRLSGEARFPAQIHDTKAAIRWLRSNASRYGIDSNRAMTWGASAGGYLAQLAAVSCGAADLEPKPAASPFLRSAPSAAPAAEISSCVQGAVVWFGVSNMATIVAQSAAAKTIARDTPEAPEWRLLGCFDKQCTQQQIASASPVTYVDRADPPLLLIVGDADSIVPKQQTLEMAEQLKSAGARHELIVLPGVSHLFIGQTEAQTREANAKALEATFRFIDQTMAAR